MKIVAALGWGGGGWGLSVLHVKEPKTMGERSAQTRSEAKLSSVYILVKITEALPIFFLLK